MIAKEKFDLNDYIIAYKTLPKSSWGATVYSCIASLSSEELIILSAVSAVLLSYFYGFIYIEDDNTVFFITSIIWISLGFYVIKKIYNSRENRFAHLKEEFKEVINFDAFGFEYCRFFLFLEIVNQEKMKPIDFQKVRQVCDIEINSMSTPPALTAPSTAFCVAFLSSTLAYAFWQSGNSMLFSLGIVSSVLVGYVILTYISSHSWTYKKITRLRKYCDLVMLFSDEQQKLLNIRT